MAFTVDQANVGTKLGSGSTSTTAVVNVANAVAAGALIIVSVAMHTTSSVTGVTDSKGNSYTIDHIGLDSGGGVYAALISGYATQALTTSDTITVTFNTAITAIVSVSSFLGGATSSWTDQLATGTGGGSTAPVTGTSAALAASGELAVVMVAESSAGAYTVGSGYTLLANNIASTGNVRKLSTEYKIGAVQAGETGAFAGTGANWAIILGTYKLASGGGGGATPHMAMTGA